MVNVEILRGDCRQVLRTMESESVNCIVTSPPYFGLRDYGVEGQIGLEQTPDDYVAEMVAVFSEARRVLKSEGTFWLNLGDSYAGSGKGRNADGTHQEGGKQGTSRGTVEGHLVKTSAPDCKPKDLIGIPWRVAFALQADGWYLRQDIIWHKPNPMPESVKDRCTKAHEYIFLFSKSPRYHFDHVAIKEPCSEANVKDFLGRKTKDNKGVGKGTYEEARPDLCRGRDAYMSPDFKRNKRSVWTVTTKPFRGAHFATFPPDLIEPCILAGCPEGGIVLDPFFGAGTTGLVALKHGRNAVGIELNDEYAEIASDRLGIKSFTKTEDYFGTLSIFNGY